MQYSDPQARAGAWRRLRAALATVPLMSWLVGALVAVLLEHFIGESLAEGLGLRKIPVLFGINTTFKAIAELIDGLFGSKTLDLGVLWQIPAALAYTLAVYVVPMGLIMRFTRGVANALAGGLLRMPMIVSALLHLVVLYVVLHYWTDLSDYRLITLKLILVSILLTLSLNLINGYMGEFSCSHPGFMALGAYMASVFSLWLFTNDRMFGEAVFSTGAATFFFPVGLFFGGLAAAAGALLVAIPSFKTRGDYLAIISLAFLFIVKSFLENLELVGGPRGLSSQPDCASLPMVFGVVVFGVWVMNNFVTSTLGKAMNAVRDDESAAEAMTVDTRSTKMQAFLFGAFWAGVAGGLFAHIMRYISPAMFGLQNLAETLAMVYFGGLNSVYGSIVGAVSISVLSEALRPLQILKWICIPLLLILVMIYRPRGLVSFKEFNVRKMLSPRGERA
ncbi:MAG: branched-chain amino acid ABC transporter permease [Desulfovibrionaceae bacterium]